MWIIHVAPSQVCCQVLKLFVVMTLAGVMVDDMSNHFMSVFLHQFNHCRFIVVQFTYILIGRDERIVKLFR